jgi:hypothetical protein
MLFWQIPRTYRQSALATPALARYFPGGCDLRKHSGLSATSSILLFAEGPLTPAVDLLQQEHYLRSEVVDLDAQRRHPIRAGGALGILRGVPWATRRCCSMRR